MKIKHRTYAAGFREVTASIRQMRAKKGRHYEKYKAGMLKYLRKLEAEK